MRDGIRIAITGSSGYLAQELLKKLRDDSRIIFILGLDIKRPLRQNEDIYIQWDVRNSGLEAVLKDYRINMLLHLAWVFNPQHNENATYAIDIRGTKNVFDACRLAGVKRSVYAGSTTAYGPWADNPRDPSLVDEKYPRRGHPGYQYARDKAVADALALQFMLENPEIEFILLRAAIVLGSHTNNIVTHITELPAMFRIAGHDPPMQFVSEDDTRDILYAAIVGNTPTGVYNVSGDGTILYSDICRLTGKPIITLPSWALYPVVQLFWKMRILKFPSGLLDFIRYPWIGDNSKLKTHFGFIPRKTSREAFLEYINSRNN